MEDKLIERLRETLKEKNFSPEMASRFIGCSHKQVYLWLKYQATPKSIYRKAISRGIERMKKMRLG